MLRFPFVGTETSPARARARAHTRSNYQANFLPSRASCSVQSTLPAPRSAFPAPEPIESAPCGAVPPLRGGARSAPACAWVGTRHGRATRCASVPWGLPRIPLCMARGLPCQLEAAMPANLGGARCNAAASRPLRGLQGASPLTPTPPYRGCCASRADRPLRPLLRPQGTSHPEPLGGSE